MALPDYSWLFIETIRYKINLPMREKVMAEFLTNKGAKKRDQ